MKCVSKIVYKKPKGKSQYVYKHRIFTEKNHTRKTNKKMHGNAVIIIK